MNGDNLGNVQSRNNQNGNFGAHNNGDFGRGTKILVSKLFKNWRWSFSRALQGRHPPDLIAAMAVNSMCLLKAEDKWRERDEPVVLR